jgi:hypothetical protein
MASVIGFNNINNMCGEEKGFYIYIYIGVVHLIVFENEGNQRRGIKIPGFFLFVKRQKSGCGVSNLLRTFVVKMIL